MRLRIGWLPACCGWAWVAAAGAGLAATPGGRPGAVEFNRDIRPILSENCYACHGPDKGQRKADLRLDTRDGLLAGHDGVQNVVPGKPDESELFQRIIARDPDERMPDPKSGKSLTPAQVAAIRAWIEQGGVYQGHWAYLAPRRPELPAADGADPARNPVDRLIRARLRDAGLRPAPEADRVTLIRRLSFDLTGLPPARAEVDAFLADPAPDAYERVVDRLLASPHYGERMAMGWLDAVRYADSIGYHSDTVRNVWPYRDYVIRAFNENLPFDRFTVEQLAGDLLPDSTQAQKVASGYNRLLQTTEEGGAQAQEYAAKYAADRVRNVSSAWLGSTMGCCECHDHKFDPFTTREFYGLAAFFADIQEPIVGAREPGLPLPDPAQAAELGRLDERVATLKRTLAAPTPGLAAAQAEWEATQGRAAEWVTLDPTAATATAGTTLARRPAGALIAVGPAPAQETYLVRARAGLAGITAFRLDVLPDPSLPGEGPGTAGSGNFVLTEFKVEAADPGQPARRVVLRRALADFAQSKWDVAGAIDGNDKTGWAIDGGPGRPHVAIFEVIAPVGGPGGTELTFTIEQRSDHAGHNLGKFRLSATASPGPSAELEIPAKVRALLAVAPDRRDDGQRTELAAYYRSIAPTLRPARAELAGVEDRRKALLDALPKSLVSVSGPPRVVRVLPRGNWQAETGEVVEPGVPKSLGRIEAPGRRLNRLDLARWVASRENPLTARVAVNRLWKQFFGQGLARSLEDLGSQGDWPTHPELLDWLAVEFMDGGWDVKRVVKGLVTSGAYRQASTAPPELRERDPFNRLYARQSRFRLDAELVRDNALAVAGLLALEVGGPSVKPYQPAGYWDQLNFPTRTWVPDRGDAQYRRGLYTHWQRTFLHPSLQAFDAPTREECTVDRPRSNIPQQALVLLNDPTYVEAARALAERVVRRGGQTPRDRIGWAFAHVTSRLPEEREFAVLDDLLAKQAAHYRADPDAARKLVAVGQRPIPRDLDTSELAAWTEVARVLLNLHESMTRD